jgi:hypothetical protein
MKDNYFMANEKQRVQHFVHSRWGKKVANVHTMLLRLNASQESRQEKVDNFEHGRSLMVFEGAKHNVRSCIHSTTA